MCGIAGIIDLASRQPIRREPVERMAAAIVHRGPDEEGFLFEPGLAFANRRLSIIGLANGQQPIFNEDRTVAVVFNGELFDFPEKRADLEARGHRFATSCDTEILVHMWEEYGMDMLLRLRGQFAFALYDYNERRVVLARDRIGIVPLHWARRGDRFYFGSEIKAILASGEVEPEPDPRGIDNIFTFFAMPGRRTCFRDISQILPGHFLDIRLRDGATADIEERQYWDIDFPDQGDEVDPGRERLLEEFREVLNHAATIRLRADVPVVSYLSGGIDSTTILATASRIHGRPLPSFTIEIPDPKLNELDRALLAADVIGSKATVVTCDSETITSLYPDLVRACDAPVMDTSCAALLGLAREVHAQGFKVALTGEGADEALAGYPWLKVNRLLNLLDFDSVRPSNLLRYGIGRLVNRNLGWANLHRYQDPLGGPHGVADLYAILHSSKTRFYSDEMFERLAGHTAFDNLVLDTGRMQRWHPLNRALYLGYKVMLPGLLMNQKGDRPAMASSVETRYPFLDEEFVAFCASIHPRWKLKGLFRDKRLLRESSSAFLPAEITERPKKMFRAPFATTFFGNPPAYVDQLLSAESLARTGLFDPDRVRLHRETYRAARLMPGRRLFGEMGLTAVMATQLWFHTYIHHDLCELPSWSPDRVARPAA